MRKLLYIIVMFYLTTSLQAEPLKKHQKRLLLPPPEENSKIGAQEVPSPVRPYLKKPSLPGTNPPATTSKKVTNGRLEKIPCTDKIPIETFVQISSATHPQASKSGGVYFLSDFREIPQIFFQSKPGQWPEQISFFPDGVSEFEIGPDGTSLLLTSQVDGDEQFDLYLLNSKRQIKPLIVDRTKRVQSFKWGPKGDWLVYTSNARNKVDMDLYHFDLKTQRNTLLTELKGYTLVSDVSPDGKSVVLTSFRSVTDSDVLLFEMDTKNIKNLTNSEGRSFQDHAKFTSDGKALFYLSDRSRGLVQLVFHPLTSQVPSKTLTSDTFEIEDFALSDSRRRLTLLGNREGYTELRSWQLDKNGQFIRPIPMPKNENSVIKEPHLVEGSLFFSETSSQATADIWEWNGKEKIQWTKSTQGLIDRNCLVREELIHYPSFDKTSIPAFLFESTVPKPELGIRPYILFLHGGPESQYRPIFSKTFQYFLQRGFGVLAPNVRGSSGYGREYLMSDNYKNRIDSVKDAIEGAKWLIQSGRTKAGHLFVYGGSYGGFMVLRIIQLEPELFAAASESVGITNFVTFLQNTKGYRRALREVEYGPITDTEFLKSISPSEYIDAIKTPLLIFHGANDPRVPVSETEQIVEALKEKGIKVDFRIFNDEGHGNRKLKNILEQARLMTHFFEQAKKGVNP